MMALYIYICTLMILSCLEVGGPPLREVLLRLGVVFALTSLIPLGHRPLPDLRQLVFVERETAMKKPRAASS